MNRIVVIAIIVTAAVMFFAITQGRKSEQQQASIASAEVPIVQEAEVVSATTGQTAVPPKTERRVRTYDTKQVRRAEVSKPKLPTTKSEISKRDRRTYDPRRQRTEIETASADSINGEWMRVPGTGVGLWPKP